jgi:hypothetical protein
MLDLNPNIIIASAVDNFLFISKTLLFVRSVLIVFGFQKTNNTLREELYDLYIRLWAAVLYTAIFMIAIYWGLLCGYYFRPASLRVFWTLYGY